MSASEPSPTLEELADLLHHIQEIPELVGDHIVALAAALERVSIAADDGSLSLNLDDLADDDVGELYRLATAVAVDNHAHAQDLTADAEEFDRKAQKIIDAMVRYNATTVSELYDAIRKAREAGAR
jgi:hypothetical protein